MSTLLKDTVRSTAFMLVPVIAFLAILSAVALFAVPRPAGQTPTTPAVEAETPTNAPSVPNARAALHANKI